MPRPELLRLGGTASAMASNGSMNIIITSTSRKLKCASPRRGARRAAAAVAEAP